MNILTSGVTLWFKQPEERTVKNIPEKDKQIVWKI